MPNRPNQVKCVHVAVCPVREQPTQYSELDGAMVATDVAAAVQNAKAGQVRFRTDKGGIIHSTIGKSSFEVDALTDNLHALLVDLVKLKPASAKGQYLKRVSVSTTMGPGLVIDHLAIKL